MAYSIGKTCTVFQTRFVIGRENNRNGDITKPLSLKTIDSAGYRDQRNKRFGWGEGQSILFRHPPGLKGTDT